MVCDVEEVVEKASIHFECESITTKIILPQMVWQNPCGVSPTVMMAISMVAIKWGCWWIWLTICFSSDSTIIVHNIIVGVRRLTMSLRTAGFLTAQDLFWSKYEYAVQ